ncbi:MAG: helix-turn-helix domain-containing protein [Oligoflexales bacterium]
MKISKNKSFEKILNFVDEEALAIAKSHGMKEIVHMFEASLIAHAIKESEGNSSEAARSLQVPVTTLGSRKEVLEIHVKKGLKKLKFKI